MRRSISMSEQIRQAGTVSMGFMNQIQIQIQVQRAGNSFRPPDAFLLQWPQWLFDDEDIDPLQGAVCVMLILQEAGSLSTPNLVTRLQPFIF
jgi:hypothetical protein